MYNLVKTQGAPGKRQSGNICAQELSDGPTYNAGIFENLLNSGDMSFPYIPSYNIFSSQRFLKPASRQFQVIISGGYNSVLQISVTPELANLTSLPVLTTRTITQTM